MTARFYSEPDTVSAMRAFVTVLAIGIMIGCLLARRLCPPVNGSAAVTLPVDEGKHEREATVTTFPQEVRRSA